MKRLLLFIQAVAVMAVIYQPSTVLISSISRAAAGPQMRCFPVRR